MNHDIPVDIDEKTIDLIKNSAVQFKLTLEMACRIYDIEEKNVSSVVKFIKETFDDKFIDKIDVVKKNAVRKSFKGAICGLRDEIASVKSFIESDEKGILLIIGKEYSGKTTVLNKAMEGHEEIYKNYIDEISDFLEKKEYSYKYAFPIIYIIDNIDEMKIDKRKMKKVLDIFSGEINNKIIITAKEFDEKIVENLPNVVKIENVPFQEVISFFKEYRPALLSNVSDKTLLDAYNDCGKSFFKFYKWLTKKEDIVTTKNILNVLSHVTKEVYTNPDRNAVHDILSEKLVDDDDKDDEPGSIVYFNQLDAYLVENAFNFFEDSDPSFQHNLDILDHLKRNRFYIEVEKIRNLLAYGMKKSSKTQQNVLLPYSYTYIKYKAGKKLQKRR